MPFLNNCLYNLTPCKHLRVVTRMDSKQLSELQLATTPSPIQSYCHVFYKCTETPDLEHCTVTTFCQITEVPYNLTSYRTYSSLSMALGSPFIPVLGLYHSSKLTSCNNKYLSVMQVFSVLLQCFTVFSF